MTLFGILWLSLIIFALFSRKRDFLACLVIISTVFQCDNVVNIGGVGIGPQIITSGIFFVWSALNNLTKGKARLKIKKKILVIICGILLLFLSVLISCIYNKVLGKNIVRILMLLIYILCFIEMFSYSNKISNEKIYFLIRNLTIFVAIVGIIQFLISGHLLPRLSLMNQLFYNDHSEYVYYYSDYYTTRFRMLSTFMEPSYFACYMIGAFYYLLSLKDKRKDIILLLAVILLEIILTFSSTAYGALAIVGFIYILKGRDKKTRRKLLVIGIIGFAVMYVFFFPTLDRVLFSKMSSESALGRNTMNELALAQYRRSKFLGVGYKEARGSNLYTTLLGEQGVFGLASFVVANIPLIYPIFQKRAALSLTRIGISFAILGVVVCQFIAVPDIDIGPYWMWLNLFALSYS